MGDLSTPSEVLETGSGFAAATLGPGSFGTSGTVLGNAAGLHNQHQFLGANLHLEQRDPLVEDKPVAPDQHTDCS